MRLAIAALALMAALTSCSFGSDAPAAQVQQSAEIANPPRTLAALVTRVTFDLTSCHQRVDEAATLYHQMMSGQVTNAFAQEWIDKDSDFCDEDDAHVISDISALAASAAVTRLGGRAVATAADSWASSAADTLRALNQYLQHPDVVHRAAYTSARAALAKADTQLTSSGGPALDIPLPQL